LTVQLEGFNGTLTVLGVVIVGGFLVWATGLVLQTGTETVVSPVENPPNVEDQPKPDTGLEPARG